MLGLHISSSNRINNFAFSLVELMVTIVIVGVLSGIAFPSYQKYVVNAKMVEVYNTTEILTKNQIQLFHDLNYFPGYRTFQSTLLNYAAFYTEGLALTAIPPSVIQSPHPYPVGTRVTFDTVIYSGETDATGTQLGAALPITRTILNPSTMSLGFNSAGSALCSPVNIGALVSPTGKANYDWALITSTRDFKPGDLLCTRVFKWIEKTSTGDILVSPLVLIHVGE